VLCERRGVGLEPLGSPSRKSGINPGKTRVTVSRPEALCGTLEDVDPSRIVTTQDHSDSISMEEMGSLPLSGYTICDQLKAR